MSRILDETGNRYGKLTVLKLSGTKYQGKANWLCRCGCGTEVEALGTDLRSERVLSCKDCAPTLERDVDMFALTKPMHEIRDNYYIHSIISGLEQGGIRYEVRPYPCRGRQWVRIFREKDNYRNFLDINKVGAIK